MISQLYLKSGYTHIMCILRSIYEMHLTKGVVILIPGFSQSSSDIDYFMTNLSNVLNRQGYVTVQVDIYGHGDSYGDLSELTVRIMQDNVISVYEYVKSVFNDKPIYAISRGFYGNLLCDENLSIGFSKMICINPVIAKLDIKDYIKCKKDELIEISERISLNSSLENLFAALGAENTNLRGQCIKGSLLWEIADIINYKWGQPANVIILSSYNDQNRINRAMNCGETELTVDYISNHCFVRDADWQFELINFAVAIIEE